MVSESKGKKMMKAVVNRFLVLHDNPSLIEERLISEQDITTKFVLPMLSALNWDKYHIDTRKGPEVREKAYRVKDNVKKGLPDIMLSSDHGDVFVEVKRPPLCSQGLPNLSRYGDANLIILTSFEQTAFYCCPDKKRKPVLRKEWGFKEYVTDFHSLWRILSNTEEGRQVRAAYKATRELIR